MLLNRARIRSETRSRRAPPLTSNRKRRDLISQIKRSISCRGLFLQTQRLRSAARRCGESAAMYGWASTTGLLDRVSSCERAISVDLGAGFLHDLGPLRRLGFNDRGKLLRRCCPYFGALNG